MFIGIATTIPGLPNLPGQGGSGPEVTLDYSSSNFCANASDPTLTDASPAGGVFSYTGAGTLSLNTSNGAIDISNSTPGNYIVTYTVAGVGSSNFPINISALDDASFSYSASAFCADAPNQTPTVTTPGGTFTSQDITFRPFQMQFEVSSGVSKTITIPATVGSSYTVDWGDGTTTTESTGTITHTYNDGNNTDVTNPTVSIGAQGDSGPFTTFEFNNGGSKSDLLDVPQWGSIVWSTMKNMFEGCNNINFTTITATDTPNLSGVTNMYQMFYNTTNLQSVNYFNDWDVSSVTNMRYMFYLATSFNSDISSWDVSSVEDMDFMFTDATNFNSDISYWDVSNVTNMAYMFRNATSFNQNISSWDVSNVTSIEQMFHSATSFNQNLSTWSLNTSSFGAIRTFFNSGMTTANYTDTIVGWANYVYTNSAPYIVDMNTQSNRTFDRGKSGGANFTDAGEARDYLTGATANWTITGDTEIN